MSFISCGRNHAISTYAALTAAFARNDEVAFQYRGWESFK